MLQTGVLEPSAVHPAAQERVGSERFPVSTDATYNTKEPMSEQRLVIAV